MPKLLFILLSTALLFTGTTPLMGQKNLAGNVRNLVSEAERITIFHTSDAHGFFYPRQGQGGYASLSNVIKQEPGSLLLDSGDFSQGSAETYISKGLRAIEMMNAMSYDAATLGNHEFDFGKGQAIRNLKQANFSVLAANILNKDVSDLVRPYQIFDVKGMRVAVIGLACVRNEKTADVLALLSEMLPKIQKEQADVVVLLTHHALPSQRHIELIDLDQIAEQFSGQIHVIMGGHAHHIVQNETRHGVLFVESGSHLQYVSKVTIEKEPGTGKIKAYSELIPLVVEQTGEDASVKDLAEVLFEPGENTIVGTTGVPFKEQSLFPDHLDSPLNNWVADLIRQYSGAEIGLHNIRSIRGELHQGEITERDLIEIYPFDDTVVRFPISGQLLQKIVENKLGDFAFSGLEITYVQHENGTKQIASIQVNGEPLDPNQTYILATNSYVALGKNGSRGKFITVPRSLKTNVGRKTIRTLMQQQLRAQSPLMPPATGRIREVTL